VTPPDKRARQKERSRAAREAREAAQKRERRKSMAIRFGVAGALVAIAIGIASFVGGGGDDDASSTETSAPTETTVAASDPATAAPAACATITTNFGVITAELDTTNAPIGAGHFIELANKGFYDGLTWHRVVKDFVIQGGDPEGTGSGGSGSSVVGEVPTDHYPVGSLAAAKTGSDPAGTFDSQFFIVTGSQGATLPNDYARFGSVVSGIEVAQAIEALAPASGDGPPTAPATIDSVKIDPATCGAAPTPTSAG
jgi:peptidyl-prolyl cis-trans isomerase B (cyclophilin B)